MNAVAQWAGRLASLVGLGAWSIWLASGHSRARSGPAPLVNVVAEMFGAVDFAKALRRGADDIGEVARARRGPAHRTLPFRAAERGDTGVLPGGLPA